VTTPTIIPDPSPIFPNCATFGYVAEPNYLVKITSREGGFERRQRMWSRPLTRITAHPTGDQPQKDIESVIAFWHAMGGLSSAFRATDWTDYLSCSLDDEPSALDMPLVLSGDSPASYRLVKQYTAGSVIQQREILKPLGASILVANELGEVQTAWTLDESTGLVTTDVGFSGTPTSWGGEFYIWCRFDAQLNPSVSNYKIMNITVQLAEIRLPLP
jgi:uncharacterized protein (TIGR02217 family)